MLPNVAPGLMLLFGLIIGFSLGVVVGAETIARLHKRVRNKRKQLAIPKELFVENARDDWFRGL